MFIYLFLLFFLFIYYIYRYLVGIIYLFPYLKLLRASMIRWLYEEHVVYPVPFTQPAMALPCHSARRWPQERPTVRMLLHLDS